MSGFYDDEIEDKSLSKTVVCAICAASVIFLAFLLILYYNNKPVPMQNSTEQPVENVEDDFKLGDSQLTSKDLDFWDMTEPVETDIEEDHSVGTPAIFTDEHKQTDQVIDSDEEPEYNSNEISVELDGQVMKFEMLDIAKSSYKREYLQFGENQMYLYDDGSCKSSCGITVSSDMGNIEWDQVKSSSIDYAMIRAVRRDPINGIVSTDSNYSANAAAAAARGIQFGAIVQTAAVNENEVKEESNYAIAAAQNSGAKLPVVLDFTANSVNLGRLDNMTNKGRTKIALAFCENVTSFGLTPVIYGTRDFLIANIDVDELAPYDIWVKDVSENAGNQLYFTDYPYKYAMWSYSDTGNVNGIVGNVELSVNFVKFDKSTP